jgi:large subunit ribosomal protein L10
LAISKEKKQQIVADYVERMSNSQAIIFTDYRGLTVADLTELRRQLRGDNGVFQIVKNTLFKLALEQADLPIPADQIQGTIAVGYCLEEVPPVAKTLNAFSESTDILKLTGAILGTDFLGAEDVKALADLPPREVLLAQVLGAVQGPMSGLVSTFTAPLRELVQVLQARSEQGADEGRPTEAAA